MSELEEDIKHCEEVLADWHGCDECKSDHERLLSYMKELLEHRKSIMKDTNVTFDLIKNNNVVRIKERKVEETELDDYKNIKRDFKEVIEKLKKLRINIDNLVQFYDCDEIEGKDWDLVYDTMESIKQCVKNLESLSFVKGVEETKPKYRPFSLEEFLKIFNTGDLVEFKGKGCCDEEVKVAMFTGYITDIDRSDDNEPGAVEVMLGIFHYSLLDLFKDYELFLDDKWQTFGIEVRSKSDGT